MTYPLLISVQQLQALQADGTPLMVFDCTSDLMNPPVGAEQYRQAHIPGAVYADLNLHLSDKTGAADAASGGRHPLPSREKFAAWLRSIGFGNHMQAVAYDRNGVNYSGRLWWMLKWAGHDAAALLDGGLQAWQAAGGAVESGEAAARPPAHFQLGLPLRRMLTTEQVAQGLQLPTQTIVDARAAARYRGETEPIDPVAGHIPGALNRPFPQNLGADGRFKPAAELREEFKQLLGSHDPATVVHHCGSGVSAIPNLIAMEIAGFSPTVLYAGSWSEWCNTPGLPVAIG